jgi:recombination protein RecA
VSVEKKKKLQMALDGIQKRWGTTAIGLINNRQQRVPHIPTGFPSLDKLLSTGGIPQGRISEIIGVPTSGMATMALRAIANAQSQQGTAVYIDLEQTFDPDYADHCGVSLSRLILVHPYNVHQALAMLPDFVLNGGLHILVFDMPLHLHEPRLTQSLSSTLGRLIAPLSKLDCALLFLTTLLPGSSPSLNDYPQHITLPYYATLRLVIQKERWLYRRHDIAGYEALVLIAKNKLGRAGQATHITINFPGIIPGDHT